MFKKGHKKIGGRVKGGAKARFKLHELCDQANINVFQDMLTTAVNVPDPIKRFYLLNELAPYLYPKLKNLEITLADLPDEEILAEAEKRLTKKPE